MVPDPRRANVIRSDGASLFICYATVTMRLSTESIERIDRDTKI